MQKKETLHSYLSIGISKIELIKQMKLKFTKIKTNNKQTLLIMAYRR